MYIDEKTSKERKLYFFILLRDTPVKLKLRATGKFMQAFCCGKICLKEVFGALPGSA
jgi:hypothetical protein